ncbi:aldolase [Roseomonas sp. KE2513]|uniref:3-oxo-tetronate 4-phosphate decarboxylase n=1 Tax=Roseomonas sp. KE2513 TaxID=2479202 RepID=UPI0018E06377|nr:aldolase [Roseomonas sp. KE2513]MBI0537174.1 aldolase [Roseomonas sp. KE2513]
MDETALREAICAHGRLLFGRGYSVGSAGNISVRLPDGYLITPTNSCLGRLEAARISKLDLEWRHLSGDKPSKEVFMHRAVLTARPEAGAVVHLHSTHATAIGCLATPGEDAPIPPLTPYFVMRIGRRLPVIRYYRPGDAAMEGDIHEASKGARAVLLANHGPVVSGSTLDDAVYAAEELEEAARLALLLRGLPARELTPEQVDDLLNTFG